MLATRTRDLPRFRRGGLPAGTEFADQSVAYQAKYVGVGRGPPLFKFERGI